ncbi:hypothetical protein C2G38_2234390 [Gigaspora rosea]|uniref:Uncharacterized protein n=1 Tax=Gigaspora rosea TaxID=44941 RepID=A0A397TZ38_9GLOM|nr:hypothetical protein C2G38_2234390 [Gigaspora rosea]
MSGLEMSNVERHARLIEKPLEEDSRSSVLSRKKWRWNASHKKIFERSSKSSSANAMKARRDYYKELSKLLLMKATFLNSSSLPCPIMRFVTAETGKSPALADAPPVKYAIAADARAFKLIFNYLLINSIVFFKSLMISFCSLTI